MSPAILASGSCGGDSIGFEPHAPFPQTEVYVLKGCELCPKTFLTLAMAPLKDCPECRERTARHKEEMATPIPNVSAECVDAEIERKRADYALSMRATA